MSVTITTALQNKSQRLKERGNQVRSSPLIESLEAEHLWCYLCVNTFYKATVQWISHVPNSNGLTYITMSKEWFILLPCARDFFFLIIDKPEYIII